MQLLLLVLKILLKLGVRQMLVSVRMVALVYIIVIAVALGMLLLDKLQVGLLEA
jgi:hypothetical protein